MYLYKKGSKTAHLAAGQGDTACRIISTGTMKINEQDDLVYTDNPGPIPICRHCKRGWVFAPPYSQQPHKKPPNAV